MKDRAALYLIKDAVEKGICKSLIFYKSQIASTPVADSSLPCN